MLPAGLSEFKRLKYIPNWIEQIGETHTHVWNCYLCSSTDLWDNKDKDLHMTHSTQPNLAKVPLSIYFPPPVDGQTEIIIHKVI